MRTLLIYSTTLEDDYKPYYEILAKEFARGGGEMLFAMPPDILIAPSTFSGALRIADGWTRVEGPIAVDAIFNKSLSPFKPEDGWIINHPVLDAACDKDDTAALFAAFCPRSTIVGSADALRPALETLRTDTIVMKPTSSYGGDGVWIGPRSDMPTPATFPVVIQEFIDTSGGIPGVCEGRHDLRLITLGGRLVDCYVRRPAKDGYLSNVAQGGSIKQVPLDAVPESAKQLATKIDAAFSNFPDRIYSADMGLDSDGTWKLIELNSPPGLPQHEEETGTQLKILADFLWNAEKPSDTTLLPHG